MKLTNKTQYYLSAIVLFLFLLRTSSHAQTYFGLHFEPFVYGTNIDKQIYFPPPSLTNEHSTEASFETAFSFSFKVSEDIKISLRPGFIFTGNLYTGIDGAIYGSYFLSSRSYIMSGINTHIEGGGGGNTYSGEDATIPYMVVGYGYYLSKKIPLELQFNYPLNQEKYGRYRELFSMYPYTVWHYYKVAWMIKLSIGVEWEL